MNKTLPEIMDYLEYGVIGGQIPVRLPDLPAGKMHIYSGYFLWLPDFPDACGLKTLSGRIAFPVTGLQLKSLDDVKNFFKTRIVNEADLI